MEEDAGGCFEPDMPDPGAAAYLLGHFWAAGPALGETSLTNGELLDYQANMGITLSPWECGTLRRMSGAYLSESYKAREADCPPPYADATDAVRLKHAELDRKLDEFFD